jgi:hypothetical protein
LHVIPFYHVTLWTFNKFFLKNLIYFVVFEQVNLSHHTSENAKAAGIVHELNTLVSIWFNWLSKLFDINKHVRVFIGEIHVVYDCVLCSYSFLHFKALLLYFSFCAEDKIIFWPEIEAESKWSTMLAVLLLKM